MVLPSRGNFLISTRLGASLYGRHPRALKIFNLPTRNHQHSTVSLFRESPISRRIVFCVLVRFQRRTEQFIQFYDNEAAGRNRHVVWRGAIQSVRGARGECECGRNTRQFIKERVPRLQMRARSPHAQRERERERPFKQRYVFSPQPSSLCVCPMKLGSSNFALKYLSCLLKYCRPTGPAYSPMPISNHDY